MAKKKPSRAKKLAAGQCYGLLQRLDRALTVARTVAGHAQRVPGVCGLCRLRKELDRSLRRLNSPASSLEPNLGVRYQRPIVAHKRGHQLLARHPRIAKRVAAASISAGSEEILASLLRSLQRFLEVPGRRKRRNQRAGANK
jgi:hypothetical protein